MNVNDTVMLPTPGTHVSLIPKGYHTLTPYLMIEGAAKAISFYSGVFGATERMRMPGPNGMVMHAELTIGDSVLMLADEMPQMGAKSPETVGGSPVAILIYVPDVDGCVSKSRRGGRQGNAASAEPILRGSDRDHRRPFRPYLDRCDACGGCVPDEMRRRMANFQPCSPGAA